MKAVTAALNFRIRLPLSVLSFFDKCTVGPRGRNKFNSDTTRSRRGQSTWMLSASHSPGPGESVGEASSATTCMNSTVSGWPRCSTTLLPHPSTPANHALRHASTGVGVGAVRAVPSKQAARTGRKKQQSSCYCGSNMTRTVKAPRLIG